MAQPGPKALLEHLEALESLRRSDIHESKRRYQRFVIRGDAELMDRDVYGLNHAPEPIVLRDIGRGGIGFIAQRRLDVGSNWAVEFRQHDLVIGHQLLVIRHSRQVQQGVYLIGGQFTAPPGLLALLGVPAAAVRERKDIRHGDDQTDAHFVPPQEIG